MQNHSNVIISAMPPYEVDSAPTAIALVVPVHNQSLYLLRAVQSAIWQLLPNDELIVIDDASNDICGFGRLTRLRHRILWLRNGLKSGVSFSRNRGIEHSTTEWIKFLDADDVLAPYSLEIFRQLSFKMPPSVHIVTGGMRRASSEGVHDYVGGAEGSLKDIFKWNPILSSATFVRREALLAVGMFDERIDFEEDWDLWLRLHERYGPDAFGVLEKPLCYYWQSQAERNMKARKYTVDGVPVREYFAKRHGVQWE